MVRVEKRVYNSKTGHDEWHPIGEARNYKEAIEKFNGDQTWWMKKDHEFEINNNGVYTLCRMIKED